MFAPIELSAGPAAASALLSVLAGAVEAVDPRAAVRAALTGPGSPLGEAPASRVVVLALGKAACAMCLGAADALPGVPLTGVAATPAPGPVPPGIAVVAGAHPVPDPSSLRAGAALLAAAGAARPGDRVLALVSGGGSACAEVLKEGIALADLAAVTSALLASGAPIGEVNTVRRALSALKGGGLAGACGVPIATLVLSDVVGNDLPTIAGGPTVADPTGPGEALAVLDRHRIPVPGPMRASLLGGTGAPTAPDGPVRVVADAATAARGALAAARRLSIPAAVHDTAVTGEAREFGTVLARTARAAAPGMAIFAGETTVRVTGPGSGGRNQEAALAAAIEIDGDATVVVACLGTDGVDGPTSAAGGVADGGTVGRGRGRGLSAGSALAANDSGTYLEAVGGRLVTGPTGTNVGDVMVAWRL